MQQYKERKPLKGPGRPGEVTVTLTGGGQSSAPTDVTNLLAQADRLLRDAKEDQQNRVVREARDSCRC